MITYVFHCINLAVHSYSGPLAQVVEILETIDGVVDYGLLLSGMYVFSFFF